MPRVKKETASKMKDLAKAVQAATEVSQPNLIAKISNMPSTKATKFTSQPGKAAGLMVEAAQKKGVKRTGTSTFNNAIKANFTTSSNSAKKLQVFPKLSKPSYASTAAKQEAEQKLGNLLAVNGLLQRGNLLGAEILSQRAKTKSVLQLPNSITPYLQGSSIADPRQEKYSLVLADILNNPDNEEKYVDAIDDGLYDQYDSTIIKKAIKKAQDILRIRAPEVERSTVTRRSAEEKLNLNQINRQVHDYLMHMQRHRKGSHLSAADALKLGTQIHLPESKDVDDFFNEPEKPSGKDEATSSAYEGLINRLGDKPISEIRSLLKSSGIPYSQKDRKGELILLVLRAIGQKHPPEPIVRELTFAQGKGIRSRRRTKKYTSHQVKPSLDVDRATTKLELILGEIGGGNDSKIAKNQAADLVQYLLLNQEISKDMAKSILHKVFP